MPFERSWHKVGKNGFLPSGGQADPSLLVQTGMQTCPSPSERPNPTLRATPLLAYCLWSWLFCPLLCDGPASFREESPPVVQELAVHWLIDYSPSMGGGRSLHQEGPDSSFPLLLLFGCHIKGYRVFWGPGNQLCSVNGNLCPRTDHYTRFAYVQFDAPLFELVFFFFFCALETSTLAMVFRCARAHCWRFAVPQVLWSRCAPQPASPFPLLLLGLVPLSGEGFCTCPCWLL